MSTMIRTERRFWLPLAAVGSTLLMALIAITILAVPADRPGSTGRDVPPVTVSSDGEVLPQANWRVRVFPTDVKRPSKAQKVKVSAQREPLQALVATVYDSLLLEGNVEELAGKHATADAARAMERSKLRLPKGMTEVETLRRSAKVGVDSKATHAAATVVVAFRGTIDGKSVKMLQRATLWIEKKKGSWKVIAFSGEMGRVR